MILADRTTNPAFAAADMLSQAEHGSGLEQSVIVADSKEFLDKVEAELHRQSATLPRSRDGGKSAVARHLSHRGGKHAYRRGDRRELCAGASGGHVRTSPELLPHIKAAGAIFLGPWTPEPAGDFTAGPSHVLPTAGTAKFFHGLSTMDFMRRSSLLEYTKEALMKEVSAIECFASLEGLDAHGRSASIRRDWK